MTKPGRAPSLETYWRRMLDREAGIRRLREYAIYPETPEVAEREDATAPEAPVEAVAPNPIGTSPNAI